jgi:hypothetical protein
MCKRICRLLINAKGGIDGYKIRINELDNNYQVPPAIEEYWSQAGAAITFVKERRSRTCITTIRRAPSRCRS